MRWITIILLFTNSLLGQFNYSGYVYNANGTGAVNVPVKLYRRTTSAMSGFSSQTNYNGHSYYRSTGTAIWSTAKSNCEAMGGHLATVSNTAENNFLYNTWPSGWIGYYQDKVAGYTYSEPSGGFRWTETQVTNNLQADYDVSSYTSGTTLTDIRGAVNATLYNSPAYTSTSGKYLTFNGTNQYAITGNLGSKVGMNVSLMLWIYPTGNGVVVTELGSASTASGWHDSQIEITGGNTLRMAVWGMSGNISTTITLNAWHLVVLTYDGTNIKGYLDNVNFATSTVSRNTPQASGNGLYYGIGLTDFTNLGSGAYGAFRLGDFQVFSKALTADEIDRTYNLYAYRYKINQYTNWNPGEPNNSNNEDYTQFVGGGKWNDLINNNSLNYVLEFDYVVTTGTWALYKTVYTNASGYYSFSEAYDPTKEYYVQFDLPNLVQLLTNTDGLGVANNILGKTTRNGLTYHVFDLNNDGRINIADEYYLFGKKSGRFTGWNSNVPYARFYTVAEYNAIKAATSNVRATYPGVTSITTSTLTSGGTLSYYLIAPGFAGQVTY